MPNPVPLPLGDPIALPKRARFGQNQDPQEGLITQPWTDYFTDRDLSLSNSPEFVGNTAATVQSGSIGATDLTNGTLPAGNYRFNYEGVITQAASVSSTLQIRLNWTRDGFSMQFTSSSLATNTVGDRVAGVEFFRADGSPILYSVIYTSIGAPAMEYGFEVLLESLG